MNLPDIQQALLDALGLRVPAIDPNLRPAERISAMEDYANVTAIHRGRLEEALYWLAEAKKPLQREWDAVQGWEVHVTKSADRTQENIRQAKRRIRPEVYDALSDIVELQSHLHRQIRRLERDADWMSREYTFISGK